MSEGTSAADGTRYSASVLVRRLPGLVVHRFLPERLGQPLDDATVYLALDDQWVDLVAAVVDSDVLQHALTSPVSVSISTTHT